MGNGFWPFALCGICTLIFTGMWAIVFGIYGFHNPDLRQNNGEHCWVEQGNLFEPVPIGQNRTEFAVDGTQMMLNVFRAQFFVNVSMVAFLFVGIIVGVCIYWEKDSEEHSIAAISSIGCLGCAAITLLVFWLLGSTICDIWMRIIRYQHVIRVCSGDFLMGPQTVMSHPYMRSSGNLMWWYTFMFGGDGGGRNN